jgi:sigma-B regulation protein RsbU (phosphoserine phosphatase)
MKILTLSFVLTTILSAQPNVWIDLSGPWRLSSEDNAAIAQPGFDDSGWSTVTLPPKVVTDAHRKSTAESVPPVVLQVPPFWLRRTVEIPGGANRSRLTLTLGPFRRIYAVYVNGIEIGRVGRFDTQSGSQIPRTRSFPIPAEVAAVPGPMVIAIHVGRTGNVVPAWRLPQEAEYSITDRDVAGVDPGAVSLALQREKLTPSLVIAFTYLLLIVLILVAWIGDRARYELPWLAAYLIAASILDATRVWSLYPESHPFGPEGSAWLYSGIKSTSFALFTTFLIVLLGFRLYWLQATVWLLWFALQIVFNWPQVFPIAVPWLNSHLNFGLFTGATGALLVAIAWRRVCLDKSPLARHWLLLVLMLILAERLVWVYRRGAEGSFAVGGYQLEIPSLLSLALTIVIFVFLLREVIDDRREKVRLSGEMAAGQAAQIFLLGNSAAGRPDGLDVAYEPAAEVGGDFHWNRIEADGSLLLVVGDVSGKGLRAAMLVAAAIGILRNEKAASPAAVLAALNEGLVGHTGGGFVTCCSARFEGDRRVTIANAGHPAPYCDGKEVQLEAGLPLGLMPELTYTETIVEGDQFTFVSDGVVEAANQSGELFGFDRTREMSTRRADAIVQAAKAWGQNDDITVVTVRRNR